jgi:ornithine cyclodeaminase/alanine dehydrogenase-like protein (mu-crystallin family)
MTGPPYLDAGHIFRFTPFDEVVAAVRATFATGPAVLPRQQVVLAGDRGDLLVMPAAAGRTAGVKAVTARAGRARAGQPAVQGIYVLFDADSGAVVATLDGAALTARRTPAVSALATGALARQEVTRLAVFGTGVQAREHIRAMRWVRPSLEQVEVVGREPASTGRFVAMLRGEGHPVVSATPSEASGADLICTCTSSSEPVLLEDAVKPGAHINAIGSYRPERRELGETLIGRARVVVDDRAALAESGTLVLAIAAGAMSPADVAGDLVGLARDEVRRETVDEVTVFVSVGLAAADLAVATLAARNAGLIG